MIRYSSDFLLQDLAKRLAGTAHAEQLLHAARADIGASYMTDLETWSWWVTAVARYQHDLTDRCAAAILDGSITLDHG